MKKALFFIVTCIFVFYNANAQNKCLRNNSDSLKTGLSMYIGQSFDFYSQQKLFEEAQAFGAKKIVPFVLSFSGGMYYAGSHLDASLGGKLGGMVHSSSFQTVYGVEASLGYMFSHQFSRPGVVIGVNAAYERLNNHFDVNHAVMNMETHEITGNCESFVLASNQLMLGPCLKVCFDNLKSYFIVGYDFGILPFEYVATFNPIENNRKISYNKLHIGMKKRW